MFLFLLCQYKELDLDLFSKLNFIKSHYLISVLLFQDLEGGDIFAYYHPQDLPYLKQVYEAIMAEQVSVGLLLFMVFRGQQSSIFHYHSHRLNVKNV